MNRRLFLLAAPAALTACTAPAVYAPDDVVSRAIHREPGRKYLTLYTMRNTGSDNGAHTALLINASQRVIFDPAGTFQQTVMPERHDVLFGVTPAYSDYFISYHARVSYYVVSQEVEVAPQVAEQALNLALVSGPVPQAQCARITARILRQLPGFERIRQTWGPGQLSDDFGTLPGVITKEFREDDSADKSVAAREIEAVITQQP